eukprot:4889659-Amphidinium_carterae.1
MEASLKGVAPEEHLPTGANWAWQGGAGVHRPIIDLMHLHHVSSTHRGFVNLMTAQLSCATEGPPLSSDKMLLDVLEFSFAPLARVVAESRGCL